MMFMLFVICADMTSVVLLAVIALLLLDIRDKLK